MLAVLLFHVDHKLLPGGYLGVDLFFVISGFVVTKSLAENKVRYREFLLRRFYRLFPAGATTILVTLLAFEFAGQGLLSKQHVHSAIASFTATSNFYFMRHSGYFDTVLQGNPFLHFWSLSVEEQFYLVWPWLIIPVAAWRFPAKAAFLIALAMMSAAIFWWAPVEAFYLMPARAFQFGAGALAYFVLGRHRPPLPSIGIYAMLGLSIILFFTHDGTQSWPSAILLPTMIFASLVFLAANQPLDRLLLLFPIQYLGLASYSIYLAHWPIIVYGNIVYDAGIQAKVLAFLLSIMVGIALHYAIERPLNFRISQKTSRKESRFVVFGGPVIAVTTACVMAVMSAQIHASAMPSSLAASQQDSDLDEAEKIYAQTEAIRTAAIKKSWACNTFEPGRLNGNKNYKLLDDLNLGECLKGKDLLLADSTGEVAVYLLATTGKADSLAQLVSAGCSFLLSATAPDCTKMNALRSTLITATRCAYSTIYLAFSWEKYKPAELRALFALAAKSPCKFVVLSQLPSFTVNPEQALRASNSNNVDLFSKVRENARKATSLIDEISRDQPNVQMLRWSPLDNPHPELPVLTPKSEIIYRDSYHYTDAGKRWLMLQYLRAKAGAS